MRNKRENIMKKELKKLMKKNNFDLLRKKNHLVWIHQITGKKVTTSATPSCQNAIKNIMRDIKHEVGICYA